MLGLGVQGSAKSSAGAARLRLEQLQAAQHLADDFEFGERRLFAGMIRIIGNDFDPASVAPSASLAGA